MHTYYITIPEQKIKVTAASKEEAVENIIEEERFEYNVSLVNPWTYPLRDQSCGYYIDRMFESFNEGCWLYNSYFKSNDQFMFTDSKRIYCVTKESINDAYKDISAEYPEALKKCAEAIPQAPEESDVPVQIHKQSLLLKAQNINDDNYYIKIGDTIHGAVAGYLYDAMEFIGTDTVWISTKAPGNFKLFGINGRTAVVLPLECTKVDEIDIDQDTSWSKTINTEMIDLVEKNNEKHCIIDPFYFKTLREYFKELQITEGEICDLLTPEKLRNATNHPKSEWLKIIREPRRTIAFGIRKVLSRYKELNMEDSKTND